MIIKSQHVLLFWYAEFYKELRSKGRSRIIGPKRGNVLIDGKSFFDLPVKNEEETYEKIIDMG